MGELARALGIRMCAVSQHLALLRKDGIVTARREGRTIRYAVSSGPARELLLALGRVYRAPTRDRAAALPDQRPIP